MMNVAFNSISTKEIEQKIDQYIHDHNWSWTNFPIIFPKACQNENVNSSFCSLHDNLIYIFQIRIKTIIFFCHQISKYLLGFFNGVRKNNERHFSRDNYRICEKSREFTATKTNQRDYDLIKLSILITVLKNYMGVEFKIDRIGQFWPVSPNRIS